jgi:SAM-dependent methyltransferase
MKDAHEAEIHAHYERGEERDRLAGGVGRLEFIRTTEIIGRRLPAVPALVADIGGGPGRYALWLAGLGYRVEHRDLVPLHVRQLEADAAGLGGLHMAVGDARDLDLHDASADAVLLLGPLYHLRRRADRVRALAEARRVVRPGGPVFAAAVSRWAPRISGEMRERLYEVYPHIRELTGGIERTGMLPPLHPGSFCGFCHRPQQLRGELRAAGLTVADLVSVQGPASLLGDLAERLRLATRGQKIASPCAMVRAARRMSSALASLSRWPKGVGPQRGEHRVVLTHGEDPGQGLGHQLPG